MGLLCLAIGYEVSGIWFYCFFHTLCYDTTVGIRELANRQGIGLRITEDHGISG